jgi:hypothetical protein
MKKFLFISLFVSILGVSCKKNDPTPTPTPEPDKYMSLTPGSSWIYQKVDTSNQISTYTLTSSNTDTTIGLKKYHIFNETDINGTTESYYNNTGNDYSQFASLGAQLAGYDLIYLKEKATAGTTWTTPFMTTQILNGTPADISADILNTIDSTELKMTVNNIAYSNVVKVKTEIKNLTIKTTITIQGIPIPITINPTVIQDTYNYYAPKYGMIKGHNQLKISVQGQGTIIDNNSTTTLLSANIIK